MIFSFLSVCVLLSSFNSLTEAKLTHSPRMIFTDKESTMKRLKLPGHETPVHILMDGDTVTVVGKTHLFSFNSSQDPQKDHVTKKVVWEECNQAQQKDCKYNIAVVHETDKANQLFVCGTNAEETLCCSMTQSEQEAKCVSSGNWEKIKTSINGFDIKEGQPSALVSPESAEDAALYVTHSGFQDNVGIHKFGKYRVRPSIHDKEQQYVGLMLSIREDELQNKVYAFYREKNKDTGLYSEMWLPFVTQVCMADIGGPKNNLQFSWTSQLNAKLFCGDPHSKQYFSELVDVATVHADRWWDTRVYALFSNEWGMSAVCVYTIGDIDNVFENSPFKVRTNDRPRKCVTDSTKIPIEVLKKIKETSEMENWVQPVENSRPLLINRHSYTHIYADSSQHKRNNLHPVLFLSLKNGRVHKVTQNTSHAFVIAEYRPFSHTDQIHSNILHLSSSNLYVSSQSELVQLDVANCSQYGDSCEGCVLARDPYCGWNGTHCSPKTKGTMQDVDNGNYSKCPSEVRLPVKAYRRDKTVDMITLSSESKYFLQCPVTSHHAHYTWQHDQKPVSCKMSDHQCLLLIDSMGSEHVGTYTCESEESGYRKKVAEYRLQLGRGSVCRSSGPLVLVCLMVALIKSVS